MHQDLKAVRDKLFTNGKPKRETVTLNDETEVDVIGMDLDTRGKLMAECMIPDKDAEPRANGTQPETLDIAKVQPLLVVECTVFKGTDTKVFGPADLEGVKKMDATYLTPLINAAMRISGLSAKTIEAAKGNSSTTPT